MTKRCKHTTAGAAPEKCGCDWTITAGSGAKRLTGTVKKFWILLRRRGDVDGYLKGNKRQAEKFEGRLKDHCEGGSMEALVPRRLTVGAVLAQWAKGRKVDAHKLGVVDSYFGKMLVSELTEGAVRDFEQFYRDKGRAIATINRLLAGVLKPMCGWAIDQEPQLMTRNPFGKNRYRLDVKAEVKRTQRCDPHTEFHMLDACGILDAPEFNHCGATLRAFIILAIDLGMRTSEILSLRNKHIDWTRCVLTLETTKRGEPRLVPFNPKGRVGEILRSRQFGGKDGAVVCDHRGDPVEKVYRAWVHAVCIAHNIPFVQTGTGGRPDAATLAAYKQVNLRAHDLRHEASTWMGMCEVAEEDRAFLMGHASQSMQGRYSHERLGRAQKALSAKVWPREGERAVRATMPLEVAR